MPWSAGAAAGPSLRPSRSKGQEAIDWACLETHLLAVAAQHRAELFEPWRAMLARCPRLEEEVDRTVHLLRVFFDKWVVEIVVLLAQKEELRFNKLKASLPGISNRTLTHRLRTLEHQGIVRRTLRDEMPVRVDYTLTDHGKEIAMLALPLVVFLRTTDARRQQAGAAP